MTASYHLLLLLRSPPPLPLPSPSSSSSSSSFISLLKPLFLPSSNITLRKFHLHSPLHKKTLSPSLLSTPPSSSHPFSYTPPLSAITERSSSNSFEEDEEIDEETDEFETERNNFDDAKVVADSVSSPLVSKREERLKLELPSLSVKEKKELASYAHSLGKKLKTQLVGKSGVTPNVVSSFNDTLEANELLKIKIQRSCPGEFDDIVKYLEEATSSVTVGQIGRTVIIYRPSLSKLKVEEKKKQVRKLFLEKQHKLRLRNMSKEQAPKLSRRGPSWKVRGSRSETR